MSMHQPSKLSRRLSRNMAMICGVIVFLALLGIVISDLYYANAIELRRNDSKIPKNRMFDGKCHLKAHENCYLECTSVKMEQLNLHIGASLEPISCGSIKLHLKYGVFKSNKLEYKWLNRIKPNITILKLENCLIEDIQENAFSGHPFTKLRSLTIIDAKLQNLKKNSFFNLNSLVELALYSSMGCPELNVEEGALEGMPFLTSLTLRDFNLSTEALSHLTGTNGPLLLKFVTLNLSQNVILKLPSKAFNNVPYLSTLHLDNSRIGLIDKDTFSGCRNLRQLDLRENNLTSLPEGVFVSLDSILDGKLRLENNPWNCSCGFAWFQKYYRETLYIDKTSPLLCSTGKSLESVNFCTPIVPPEGHPPRGNSSYHREVRILEYGTFVSFNCRDVQYHRIPAVYTSTRVFYQQVIIKNETSINLTYYELQQDPLTVIVSSEVDLTGYHLIRFTANNKKESDCVTNFYKRIIIEGLSPGTTYIFSLLYQYEEFASPRSCFSITTQPEWKLRPWILNKHQVLTVAMLVSIGILIAGLSAFLAFICIRRYRKLPIHNIEPRSTVQPEKMPDLRTIPEEYERSDYWEPISHGYLTPEPHKYTNIYDGPLLDPKEKNGTSSSIELTAQKLLDWDLQLNSEGITRRASEADISGDYKPPLPPPNPPKRDSAEINATTK